MSERKTLGDSGMVWQPRCSAKPRYGGLRLTWRFSGRCTVLWLLAVLLGSENLPAFADNSDAKPVDQQANELKSAEELQSMEFAEARRMLKGATGNPECVWLGRRVVGLLWRDDLDTAFRHLDMYDRFGCPNDHIQTTFRCLVLNGSNIDSRAADNLNGRVQACLAKRCTYPRDRAKRGPKPLI